ncbi:MAG TPA: efflux transporter outer membrane subunit [Steroidobacteraceae bacterium]|nr:efflux transporter outer membrane subunit [Steroidobacteraceae bacterium]
MRARRGFAVALTLLLAACTLAPHYTRPVLPVADTWPADAQSGSAPQSAAADEPAVRARPAVPGAEIGWSDFFSDPRLRRLIEIALRNNRNLRVAMLNVGASQAQFRVQRANLFPFIGASGAAVVEKLPGNGAIQIAGSGSSASAVQPEGAPGSTFRYYSAGIGITSYELDLFGRLRSLSTQAFEQYLASAESRRSAQLSLVGEVAADYFAVLADEALLKITDETLVSQTQSYDLTKAMFDRDTTTLLSLKQAESAVDAARANLSLYQRQLAQDSHALVLVLGQAPPPDLPAGTDIDSQNLLADLPAGLPSDLIVRRPDILAAEHTLRAANANIGAARAAFFPRIELTGSDGVASTRLSSLFGKGTGTWSFAPTITLPIFAGGQNRANLDLAGIEKRIEIAQYELSIQTAFREVADALAARSTYREQRLAQEALVAANADAYRLAQMRFQAGVDSYLATLDAERSLYAARQGLVTLKQAELTNLVTLYKALGGGWSEHTARAP